VPTAFEAGLLFGTEVRERLLLDPLVDDEVGGVPATLAVCGFGLAAAGAGAALAIAERFGPAARQTPMRRASPIDRCYLVGIAGTYRPRQVGVGRVVIGTTAECVGIGAGSGRRHLSARQMGWFQPIPRHGLPPASDTLPLGTGDASVLAPGAALGGLLSVTAASGSRYEARQRARAHPDAVAEEMEAYAVALAARLAGVPLTVIRGISNVAGDRDTSRWRTADACSAARRVLEQLLTQSTAASPQT
jgi:futalosine hydrolase